MNMVTGFDRRHPRGVILIRVLVTVWLLALTGILLAYEVLDQPPVRPGSRAGPG
jgi:Tfp pilus assembly protein PilX